MNSQLFGIKPVEPKKVSEPLLALLRKHSAGAAEETFLKQEILSLEDFKLLASQNTSHHDLGLTLMQFAKMKADVGN